MKQQSLVLRLLNHCNDYFIKDLPIVANGTWKVIQKYVNGHNLHHVRDVENLFGGYFNDDNGNCYFIDIA